MAIEYNGSNLEECECCGGWHRAEFYGDCRDDNERYYPMDGDEFQSAQELQG